MRLTVCSTSLLDPGWRCCEWGDPCGSFLCVVYGPWSCWRLCAEIYATGASEWGLLREWWTVLCTLADVLHRIVDSVADGEFPHGHFYMLFDVYILGRLLHVHEHYLYPGWTVFLICSFQRIGVLIFVSWFIYHFLSGFSRLRDWWYWSYLSRSNCTNWLAFHNGLRAVALFC
jgi:hypothetical protein